MTDDREIVNVKYVAKKLGMSHSSVYNKLYSGVLKLNYIQIGKMIRLYKDDVDQYVKENWISGERKRSNGKDKI
jgi:excisionase family DNA binding protein